MKTDESVLAARAAVRSGGERTQKETRTRVRGVFNGTRQRLGVIGEIPGYQLYWFTDEDGKLERAKMGGWEFVTQQDGVSVPGGNDNLANPNDPASRYRQVVWGKGSGEVTYGYLMKIRQEYYDEDHEDLLLENKRRMDALKTVGGVDADKIDNRYVPKGRKQALTSVDAPFSDFNKAG